MEISIRDIGAKAEWLAKIGAFLHDATISDAARYDTASQTLSLPIFRIGYEFRIKRHLLFFPVWRMPFVPALLTVTPVLLVTPEEESGARWDGDQLVDIEMATRSNLQFKTREGVISLRCIGPATLTLKDSGPPGARLAVNSLGALIIPPGLITEIVNTPVA